MQTAIDARGNLEIIADAEERAALQEYAAEYRRQENLIHESLHERYTFIEPEWIGALTDAPILCHADDYTVEDDGTHTFFVPHRIYWFEQYQIENPWETLARDGRVVFQAAAGA